MEAITAYDSSDGEEGTEHSTTDLDTLKAAELLAKLKDKLPLNSAPYVPVRVSIN